MPAFNEQDHIEEAIRRVDCAVRQLGLMYEIIVVDDGSLDRTLDKVLNCARSNRRVRVVSYGKNQGKGFALRTGFCYANGEIIIFIDSDLDVDPTQMGEYVEALKSADMVIASKWHPQSEIEMSSSRRLLSHGFNTLVKLLTTVSVNDTQVGLKAMRRKALEKTFSRLAVKRYAYDVELLTIANLEKVKVVEFPITLSVTEEFKLKEILRMLMDLLGIAYRLRIKK
jgi:glycosyltransferase involved in cell wall biosynthesis